MQAAAISSVQSNVSVFYQSTKLTQQEQNDQQATSAVRDKLDLGKAPLSTEQVIKIVTERSLSKLNAVVGDARKALGIPDGASIDTSPEATAQRIGDFALNFFDKYQQQHPEVSGQDARKQFADFIGNAIGQGIDQAKGILDSLSALNPDVTNSINSISDLIKKRLDDFVNGGK